MTHDENPRSTRKRPSEPAPEAVPLEVNVSPTDAGPDEELPPGMERFQFPQLTGTAVSTETAPLELLHDVELEVRIDWGAAYVRRSEVLRLGPGAIVPLNKGVEEPVDIFVAGRLIARGEILVLDENYGVRVTELFSGMAEV